MHTASVLLSSDSNKVTNVLDFLGLYKSLEKHSQDIQRHRLDKIMKTNQKVHTIISKG